MDRVAGVARVALNLRGVDRRDVRRGDALLTPGTHVRTDVLDVRADTGDLPAELVVHLGSAAVPARVRPLGARGAFAAADAAAARRGGPAAAAGPRPARGPRRGRGARRPAARAAATGGRRRRGPASWPTWTAPTSPRNCADGTSSAAPPCGPWAFVAGRPVVGDWYADPAWWEAQRARVPEVVRTTARRTRCSPGRRWSTCGARSGCRTSTSSRRSSRPAAGAGGPGRGTDRRPAAGGRARGGRRARGPRDAPVRGARRGTVAGPAAGAVRTRGRGAGRPAGARRRGARAGAGVPGPGRRRAARRPATVLPQRGAEGARDVPPRRGAVLEALDAAGVTVREPDDRRRLR